MDKYRKEMLEQAAKEGINCIFTFVYNRETDNRFVRDIISKVKAHGGQACFVRLHCDPKLLLNRITRRF